jgi:gliding motility-associated-like protein
MVNYTGYFGFTASTGSLTDNHSIRNVFIRNYRPQAFGGGSQTACSGDSVQLGNTSANPAFTYAWTPSTGVSNPGIAAPKLALTNSSGTSQSFTYVLRVDSPGNACPGYDTIQITIEPRPGLPVISGDSVLCEGESLSLTAANFANAQYVWGSGPFLAGPGGNTLNYGPVTSLFNGSLYVVAIIGSCYSDTARIQLQVNLRPAKPTVRGNQIFCEGDFLSWDAIGNGTANWLEPNGFTSQTDPLEFASMKLNQAGAYRLWMEQNGCLSDTLELNVTVNPLPLPDLGIDRSFCPDSLNPLVLNPGVFPAYKWNSGLTTPNVQADTAGFYSVTVTDNNGCQGSSDVVLIEKCPFSLLMPTIFSPNDDGLNDLFRGFAKGVSSMSMRIYDRWGNLVYEAAQIGFKFDTFPWWNGSWKNEGRVVQFGRYVWVADIISDKGDNQQLKGSIQIVE